jgi:hypothetical protein
MPNDQVTDKLAAAKAAVRHAQMAFPTPANRGHEAGVAFAAAHNADHTGSTLNGIVQQAGEEAAGIKARQANIEQYNNATQGK